MTASMFPMRRPRRFTADAGSAPAQAATLEGRRVLRLPCRFQDTNVERASWDRSLQLDLTSCRAST